VVLASSFLTSKLGLVSRFFYFPKFQLVGSQILKKPWENLDLFAIYIFPSTQSVIGENPGFLIFWLKTWDFCQVKMSRSDDANTTFCDNRLIHLSDYTPLGDEKITWLGDITQFNI